MGSNKFMKNCYIYTRCASLEVTDKRESIAYQEQLCKEYAFQKGYKVVNSFEDTGVSGNTTDRKGLTKLFNEISLNPNSIVLVSDVNRIARSYKTFMAIYNLINRYNCQIETVQGGFEAFSLKMWGAFAQYEREIRSQRIKAGLAMRKKMKENQNL